MTMRITVLTNWFRLHWFGSWGQFCLFWFHWFPITRFFMQPFVSYWKWRQVGTNIELNIDVHYRRRFIEKQSFHEKTVMVSKALAGFYYRSNIDSTSITNQNLKPMKSASEQRCLKDWGGLWERSLGANRAKIEEESIQKASMENKSASLRSLGGCARAVAERVFWDH